MYSIILGSRTKWQMSLRLLLLLAATAACYIYAQFPIFKGTNQREAVIYYAMLPVGAALGLRLKLRSPHDLVATGLAGALMIASIALMVVDWHFLGSLCALYGTIELMSGSIPTEWSAGDKRP